MNLTADFVRYVVIGGAAFLLDITLLIFFTEMIGFHYLISAPIAFSMGLIFNYIICIKWVFKFRVYNSYRVEFGIFCIIGLIGILITEALLAVLAPLFGNYVIAKIISCAVVLFWNFFMRRYLLFKPRKIEEGGIR